MILPSCAWALLPKLLDKMIIPVFILTDFLGQIGIRHLASTARISRRNRAGALTMVTI
jgi:hypothetical protein